MAEPLPERGFVHAGAVFSIAGRLALGDTFRGVTSPPGGGFLRGQLVESLPLLGRDQHHGPVTWTHESDRATTGLDFADDLGHGVGVSQRLLSHLTSMDSATGTSKNFTRHG